MDTYFKTYSPRHQIKVLSIKGTDKFDISDDVTSLTTNKAYGRCSGTWQLILPYKSPKGKDLLYHQLLEPDDIVTIELDPGDGSGLMHVMTGLIDRVSVVRQGGTVPQRAIKVTGRDLGKLIEKHDIFYDVLAVSEQLNKQPSSGTQDQTIMARLVDPSFIMGTSAKIIKHAFENFFKPALTAGTRFDIAIDTDDDWIIVQPNMMVQTGCDFWSYMQQATGRPYNMLHADVDPNKVGKHLLTLEKYPLDDTGKLVRPDNKSAAVDDTEIIADDLGIGDNERVNFLFNAANVLLTSSDLMKESWSATWANMDLQDIADHGFNNWTIKSSFTPPEAQTNKDTDEDKVFDSLNKRQSILWNWYRHNQEYSTGTMALHLRPDIRAGFQLLVRIGDTDDYMSYLVEQVTHQYTIHPSPAFTTSLQLTRGQFATPAQKAIAERKRSTKYATR